MTDLTDRQKREIEYHRKHFTGSASSEVSYDVLENPTRKWWNGYWGMWAEILSLDAQGKQALVVGCGAGADAIRLAKLGAEVSAFDLSPEALARCRDLAARENLAIDFSEMPAEALAYENDTFDLILARDILHHVDIPLAVAEMRRVSKNDAVWIVNEIYSHSWTELIRRNWLVDKIIYPAMIRFIYNSDKPYITEDERKMSEEDISQVISHVTPIRVRWFNFLCTRVMPDRWTWAAKLDRILLASVGSLGCFVAGRMLMVGRVLPDV